MPSVRNGLHIGKSGAFARIWPAPHNPPDGPDNGCTHHDPANKLVADQHKKSADVQNSRICWVRTEMDRDGLHRTNFN